MSENKHKPYTKVERRRIQNNVPSEGPETRAQMFAVRYEATVQECEEALNIQNNLNDELIKENEQMANKIAFLNRTIDTYIDVLKDQDVRVQELHALLKAYDKKE